MFNLFKKKEPQNLVGEQKWVPQEPVPEPERQYYSIGPTTERRVMLKVYYGNISMDKEGIDAMIKTLEASKVWCEDESGKQPEDGCQKQPEPV
jgi:hypothetical protein